MVKLSIEARRINQMRMEFKYVEEEFTAKFISNCSLQCMESDLEQTKMVI